MNSRVHMFYPHRPGQDVWSEAYKIYNNNNNSICICSVVSPWDPGNRLQENLGLPPHPLRGPGGSQEPAHVEEGSCLWSSSSCFHWAPAVLLVAEQNVLGVRRHIKNINLKVVPVLIVVGGAQVKNERRGTRHAENSMCAELRVSFNIAGVKCCEI